MYTRSPSLRSLNGEIPANQQWLRLLPPAAPMPQLQPADPRLRQFVSPHVAGQQHLISPQPQRAEPPVQTASPHASAQQQIFAQPNPLPHPSAMQVAVGRHQLAADSPKRGYRREEYGQLPWEEVIAKKNIAGTQTAQTKQLLAGEMSDKRTECVNQLMELLKHGSELKKLVHSSFVRAVANRQALHMAELMIFRSAISQATTVPEEALGNIHDEYIRFDFDGDGMIEEHEAYKLIKYHFREYLKSLAPDLFRVNLRIATPTELGYSFIRDLGKGSFGVLKLAVDRSGKQYAIKTISKMCQQTGRSLNHDQLETLKEEYAHMREIEDTRIARVFDLFQDIGSIYLVGEPYFGKDLCDLVPRALEQGLDVTKEDWWCAIFKQCFAGLVHMHRHAMMHCDIKEPNIMLKTSDIRRPELVIIDYGLAQSFTSDKTAICGTPGYIPPETWTTGKWYPKGDCFSMGVTMYQLLTNTVPNGKGQMGLFVQGSRFHPPETAMQDVRNFTLTRPVPLDMLPGKYAEVKDLLGQLLQKDLGHRINAEQVWKHRWFSKESASLAVQPARPVQARSSVGTSANSPQMQVVRPTTDWIGAVPAPMQAVPVAQTNLLPPGSHQKINALFNEVMNARRASVVR